MLPVSVARSFDMFTIGRIAYCRERVFFPIENALLAGKGGWECTARAKYAIWELPSYRSNRMRTALLKYKHLFISF